ncbi:MAG: hypothetical protein JXB60_03060, partial [Candidatus Cloacimonetes bacterium]|nr:hypothetical protein [Candidatus Cloacimonadota bacterium]
MKKYLMVILFLLPVLQSGAYELQPGDFLHSADYQLYCSWLNKGGFKADNPVSFGRDKIEQTFRSSSGQEIKVFMPW